MLFLSTLSLRRATWGGSRGGKTAALFLSTLSLRRATFRTPRRSKWGTHFYPRSPCGERRLLQNGFLDVAAISIHALLAESDNATTAAEIALSVFLSTLSLRRATYWATRARAAQLFLSTLSLRRATPLLAVLPAWRNHFYPRSPCGERRSSTTAFSVLSYFYPRSPCGERRCEGVGLRLDGVFLSTLSLRRATISDAPSSAP